MQCAPAPSRTVHYTLMPQTLLLDLVREPPISRGDPAARNSGNPYQGRWRWWYSAIADHMIRYPDARIQDIAKALNRSPNTISAIISTDLFRTYLQQRKTAWVADHDFALRSRLTEVAVKGLDLLSDALDQKQLKVTQLTEIVETSLDRLGYAPSTGPQTVVNVGNVDQRQQTLNVSSDVLREARDKMRVVEQQKAGQSLPEATVSSPVDLATSLEATGVGLDLPVSEGDVLKEWIER